jgi:hypothetical protein
LLWVTSVVRPIRFHDLRHTTGSLLTMRGANLHSVQRILRHSDPRTTAGTYLHLEPGYLRREINLLSFAPSPDARTAPVDGGAAGADGRAAILLLGPMEGALGAPGETASALYLRTLPMERATRVELATFSLGKAGLQKQAFTGIRNYPEALGSRGEGESSHPRL